MHSAALLPRLAFSLRWLALVCGLVGISQLAVFAADPAGKPKTKNLWQVWVTTNGKTQFYSQTPNKAEAQKTADGFNRFPGGQLKGEVRGPIKATDQTDPQLLITVPGNQMVYYISADPKMPQIVADATVEGSKSDISGVSIQWTAQVRFVGNETKHAVAGTPYDQSKTTTGGHLVLAPGDWSKIRGGRVTLVATATIDGKTARGTLDGLKILGTNPSESDLRAALQNDTMRRIARQESRWRQFLADRYPYFSEDNLGGAGIMQMTPSTDDQRWDWRANVKAGIANYQTKYRASANYVQSLRKSAGFMNLVAALNKDRAANGLPALTVTIPDFTEEQHTNDAIRGYNGWAGRDPIDRSLHLHEYRLALEANGQLKVQVMGKTNQATAVWERVPAADRPQNSGDPDYVNHVLSQSP
jgi:hypothetical protein